MTYHKINEKSKPTGIWWQATENRWKAFWRVIDKTGKYKTCTKSFRYKEDALEFIEKEQYLNVDKFTPVEIKEKKEKVPEITKEITEATTESSVPKKKSLTLAERRSVGIEGQIKRYMKWTMQEQEKLKKKRTKGKDMSEEKRYLKWSQDVQATGTRIIQNTVIMVHSLLDESSVGHPQVSDAITTRDGALIDLDEVEIRPVRYLEGVFY